MNKIYKTALFSILIFQCSTVNNVGNVKLKEENYVCAYDTNLKVVYYDKWIKIYDNSDKEYKLSDKVVRYASIPSFFSIS